VGDARGPGQAQRPAAPPAAHVAEYDERYKLDLNTHASAEAQVAALADDIAYHSHDLDDGLRARLFSVEDISHLPLVGEALAAARRASLDVPPPRLRHETIRRVINALIIDVVEETRRRTAKLQPADADAVRKASKPVVGFSTAMAETNRVIKEYLYARMYHHWRQKRMHLKARRLTAELFSLFHTEPGLLPDDWRARAGDTPNTPRAATIVTDYIAGMTDRFAMDEHARLTDLSVSG